MTRGSTKDFLSQIAGVLVYLSVFSIFADILIGFEIHILATENLAPIYRSIFVIKALLCALAIILVRKVPLNLFFWVLVLVLFSKSVFGLFSYMSFKAYLQHLQFYIFILIGYVLGWYLWKFRVVPPINRTFISFSIYFTFLGTLVYFVLYQMGIVFYFGLGTQLFLLFAIVLVANPRASEIIFLFLAVLFTGKRSVLIITLLQLLLPNINFKIKSINKNAFVYAFLGVPIGISLIYFSGVAERFYPFIELFNLYDPTDIEQNRFLTYLATSGRSEEFFAYFIDSEIGVRELLFGTSPGTVFYYIDLGEGGQLLQHEFFHVSFLNYIFHLGIPVGILILFFQLKVFFWTLKNLRTNNNLLSSLYIPYFLASFFGAIVFVDILFWILFFYNFYLSKHD